MATKPLVQHKKKTKISLSDVSQYRHFKSLAVIILSVLLYANAINNGYNLDDELVTKHHRLTSQGVSAIPEIFTSSYYQDDMGYSYEYRPMVLASFALEHQIFGESPLISHFINVLLYAICCLILLKTLELLFAGYSSLFPFLVTLIFIAHPAHTEVVCNIKNRDEILSMLFGLGAFYYAIRLNDQKAFLLSPVISLLFACALMSKATVVTFALIIPLCIIFLRPHSLRTVASLSFLLLLPCYIILDFGSGFDKAKAIAGLALLTWFLYGIYHFRGLVSWIREWPARLSGSVPSSRDEAPSAYSDFTMSFSDFIPSRSVFRPACIIPSLALGALYILLMYQALSLAALIPLMALFVIAIWGSQNFSWSAISTLILLLAYDTRFVNTITIAQNLDLNYPQTFVAIIFYLALWIRRDILGAVVVSTLVALLPTPLHHWPEILLTIPILYSIRFRRARITLMVLLLVLIIHDLFSRSIDYPHMVILMCLVAFHYSWHIYRQLLIGLAIIALFLHYDFRAHDVNFKTTSLNAVSQTSYMVVSTANNLNPKIIAQTHYRPIIYLENCVSPTDPLSVRIGTSAFILLKYLQKVVLPYPMSFYYGYSYIRPTHVTEPFSLLSIVLHVILLLLALVLGRTRPVISVGLFIYLFSVFIFSDFLISIPGMIADRFLLFPSLGWCIVLVGLVLEISRAGYADVRLSWSSIYPASRYGLLAAMLIYASLTIARNGDWKDDLTLFRKDIKNVPGSAQAHNLLAIHLMQHSTEEADPGQKLALQREALSHFMAARAIYPSFFNVTYDIGRAYLFMSNPDSALVYFRQATQLDSMYPDLYKTIGDIYNYKKQYSEAIPYYSRLTTISPVDYYGFGQLSYEYYMLKRYDESIAINHIALHTVSDKISPMLNIARTYNVMDKKDSAEFYLNEILRQQPGNADARNLMNQIRK